MYWTLFQHLLNLMYLKKRQTTNEVREVDVTARCCTLGIADQDFDVAVFSSLAANGDCGIEETEGRSSLPDKLEQLPCLCCLPVLCQNTRRTSSRHLTLFSFISEPDHSSRRQGGCKGSFCCVTVVAGFVLRPRFVVWSAARCCNRTLSVAQCRR